MENEKQRMLREAKEHEIEEMQKMLEKKKQLAAFKKMESEAEVVSMPNPSPTEMERM